MDTVKEVLFTFPRNERDQVRLSAGYYNNKLYLDLRIFFLHQESQEYRPTKKGITLGYECLPELKKAIACAEQAVAKERQPQRE